MITTRFPMFAVLTGLLTLSACNPDQSTSPAGDELKRQVASLGLSPFGIEDHGDYVIVEGDIRIDKKALLQSATLDTPTPNGKNPQHPVFQYYTNALVSETNAAQIRVNLSAIEGAADWAQSVRNAIADYNAAGSGVLISEGTPADVTYSAISSFQDPNTIAVASWPSGGKPGSTIQLARNWDGLTLGEKELTMVHELGHTIGLRHDNALVLEGHAGIGANLVQGTPTEDPNSVMLRALNGRTWSGFSQYDVIALKRLYNPIRPTMIGPTMIASSRLCTWTVNTTGGVPPYTYSWYVNGPGQFSPNSGTQQAFQSYVSSVSGTYYITVNVTDATGWSNGRAMPATHTGFGGSYDHTYCQ